MNQSFQTDIAQSSYEYRKDGKWGQTKSAAPWTSLGAAHVVRHASFFPLFRCIDDNSRRTEHLHLSSIPTKTLTSKWLAWRLNKPPCNSPNKILRSLRHCQDSITRCSLCKFEFPLICLKPLDLTGSVALAFLWQVWAFVTRVFHVFLPFGSIVCIILLLLN